MQYARLGLKINKLVLAVAIIVAIILTIFKIRKQLMKMKLIFKIRKQ